MTADRLISILDNLNNLNEISFDTLDELIEEYPYCQNFQFLKAKKLQLEGQHDNIETFQKLTNYILDKPHLYNRFTSSECESINPSNEYKLMNSKLKALIKSPEAIEEAKDNLPIIELEKESIIEIDDDKDLEIDTHSNKETTYEPPLSEAVNQPKVEWEKINIDDNDISEAINSSTVHELKLKEEDEEELKSDQAKSKRLDEVQADDISLSLEKQEKVKKSDPYPAQEEIEFVSSDNFKSAVDNIDNKESKPSKEKNVSLKSVKNSSYDGTYAEKKIKKKKKVKKSLFKKLKASKTKKSKKSKKKSKKKKEKLEDKSSLLVDSWSESKTKSVDKNIVLEETNSEETPFSLWLQSLKSTSEVIESENINPAKTDEKEKKRKKKEKKKLSKKEKKAKKLKKLAAKIKKQKKKKKLKRKLKKKDKLQEKIDASLERKSVIVSPTLAEIMANQGHYKEAINIYEELLLINPEKSSYFAAQIKKLEKLC